MNEKNLNISPPSKYYLKLANALVYAVVLLIGLGIVPVQADPGTWKVTGSMNVPRIGHTATLLPNGKVLVVGGESPSVVASVEIYDSNTGKWTFTSSMSKPRVNHTATLLPNGKVLVAGGHTGDIVSGTEASAELYDPSTGKWTATGSMKEPRCGHIATLISGGPLTGKVLVSGGNCGGVGKVTAELYDPITQTWSYTGSLLLARYWGPGSGIAFPDGSVLVVGGTYDSLSSGYKWPNEAELFDPITQTWSVTQKTTNANNHPPVLLNNGLVLVAGGNTSPAAVATAELYNHATNKWIATNSMATKRDGPSLTRLANGKVLVAGGNSFGWGGCGELSSTEIYDPYTGNWSSAGFMANARTNHSATLLPNGKVLIAGGLSNNCSSRLSSAELYTPATITPLFATLPDVNQDGSPEIVLVTYNENLKTTTAQVKNVKTGLLINQLGFNGLFVPKRIAIVPDLNANGAKEIAVLGIRESDQSVQIEIRDGLTGIKLSVVPLPKTLAFSSIGLVALSDSSCGSKVCLAVLQQNDTTLSVQINDALTGTVIRNIRFSNGFNGKLLGLINDLNGNKKREFAMLVDAKTPGSDYRLEIRDSNSGSLIRNIRFPTGQTVNGLSNLADLNKNGGTDLASLLPNIPQVQVVDTKTGATLNTIVTTLTKPFVLRKEIDSVSDINIVVLGIRSSDGKNVAEVYNSLTGNVVHSIVFSSLGRMIAFLPVADVNGNGSSELVRLREQSGTPKFAAEIRDGATGVLINTIGF